MGRDFIPKDPKGDLGSPQGTSQRFIVLGTAAEQTEAQALAAFDQVAGERLETEVETVNG